MSKVSKIATQTKELIGKYQSHPNTELELRLKNISKETFETAYRGILQSNEYTPSEIELSINTISDNLFADKKRNKQIRKQIFTANAKGIKKVSDEYLTKESFGRPIRVHDYIDYSINLSKELPEQPFNSSVNADSRIKVRASFITKDGQWRMDLTAIKMVKLAQVGPFLAKTIKEIFVPMTFDDYLSKLNYDHINMFEIEIEHVGDKQTVDEQSLQVITPLFHMLSRTYTSDQTLKDEIAFVAEKVLLNENLLSYFKKGVYGMKRLINQGIAINRHTYAGLYPPDGHYVTEKADGIRCIISIYGNRCRLLTDQLVEFYSKDTTLQEGPITIADSELIVDKVDSEGRYVAGRILIFDVLCYNDESIVKKPFSERMLHLPDVEKLLKGHIALTTASDLKFTAQVKTMVQLNAGALKTSFDAVHSKKYPYEIDGLMIVEPSADYFTTRWYKWKPVEHNTIDFLAIKAPSKLLGRTPYITREGYDLYLLFVGIRYDMQTRLGIEFMPAYNDMFPNIAHTSSHSHKKDYNYYPIQFSPSGNPIDYLYYHPTDGEDIDRQIIEMTKVGGDSSAPWEIIKIRHDRAVEQNYFGNNYEIAETIYQNFSNPLLYSDLYDFQAGYFAKNSTDTYKAKNGFFRFVVGRLIKTYMHNSKLIMDLGSGRGADIQRYQENSVERALFIDNDKDALMELIQRKFNIMRNKKMQYQIGQNRKNSKGMTVHVHQADLTTDYQTLIDAIKIYDIRVGEVDGVMCNFAMHYFCDTVPHLQNVIKLINSMLRIGGCFIMTVMDGASVFELLDPLSIEDSHDWTEDGVLKYQIRKRYKAKKIANVGQKIAVKLPFTDELYEEPLCNVEYVIAQFGSHGMELELDYKFAKYIPDFATANKVRHDDLTPADLSYIGIHRCITFRKVKKL